MGAIVGAFLGLEIKVGIGPNPLLLKRGIVEACIKVLIQNQLLNLTEGQEVDVGPFYVFVERMFRDGCPGQAAILSIAQLSEKLTREMIMNCTKRFANPNISTHAELPVEPAKQWWQVWP